MRSSLALGGSLLLVIGMTSGCTVSSPSSGGTSTRSSAGAGTATPSGMHTLRPGEAVQGWPHGTPHPSAVRNCTDTQTLSAEDGHLFLCEHILGPKPIYVAVSSCADEQATDPQSVGAGGKKTTWKLAPRTVTVYPSLPSGKLRYEAAVWQGDLSHLTASGTYVYPQGEKPSRSTAVDIPTYVRSGADPKKADVVFTRICFAE